MPDISDRLLSERMKELEAEGIVERHVSDCGPVRVEYALTDKGRALEPDRARPQELGAQLAAAPVVCALPRTPTNRENMADQPQTADDVKSIVDDRDIRFIRFWFTDILGQLKSFSINKEELDDAFEGGMGFDGSSITGFNAIEESDMIAMPDPSTFAILPWRPGGQGRRADVLRRRHAEPRALRGRPAPRPAPRAPARRVDGLRHLQRRP